MVFIRERDISKKKKKRKSRKRNRTVCVNETDGQNRKEIC